MLTQGGGENMRAVTILQNVRVIGVDQLANEDANNPVVARTVTVEVSPENSQKLALAQNAGTLSLTLRTLDAVVDKPLDSIRLSDILQEKSPTDEEVQKTRIKVRRANEVSEVEISN